ncbi:hypothetical protein K431DRAFT_236602 [Polychaeton citri CBS 116435]|uniref:Uncharacterized protein n=1 Tax=Polychaeton citri CBS 116435 TaxID=1314669 RepID=A0A9P4Q0M6_9PEZI|nr:hypothetical protein K431DRAFT_236602 [Polychaeton citri CBS 116435]
MPDHNHQNYHHNPESSKRSRPYSPQRDSQSSHGVKRRKSRPPDSRRVSPHYGDHHASHAGLPYGVPHLNKHDLKQYRNLFAEYLDVQKGLNIKEIRDHEVKGRWKSFLKKWNSNELAVGWYDSDRSSNVRGVPHESRVSTEEEGDDDDDDDIGPALPLEADGNKHAVSSGPAMPNFSDLQYAHELTARGREAHFSILKEERKHDRKLQKERIEELVPRSDPGSRERQLEKKREVAAANRAFKNAKESGDAEIDDGDLMGDDGQDGFKRRMKDAQKKKTEREVRRDEVLRARRTEREERLKVHREKEEKILAGFKELVRAKYG